MFCEGWDYSNSEQKDKRCKLKTSLKGYKTEITIFAYPGLAYSGFEQPGKVI